MINFQFLLSVLICGVMIQMVFGCTAQDRITGESEITVMIDLSTPDMISEFEIGFTHVHSGWENGHPEAVDRVKRLFTDAKIRYQATHIMGWGVGNPNPQPGVYNWASMDSRMDMIRSMEDAVPIITLCTAPGWMKTSGNDWSMDDRVADEHVDDFAELSRKMALRYPDVEYFQIWNEFKGYRSWDNVVETKNMESFNKMYNAVYNAIREVRPDAKIGGPYIPMEGRDPGTHEHEVIGNWLENTSGADFFTFDGWVEGWPPGGNTEEWMMERTYFFGFLANEFRAMADLPMWATEYYPGRSDNEQFTAANHASTYYHSLKSGTRLAILWGEYRYSVLFSHTSSADGGQPTPHYYVVRDFNQYFGPGIQLYKTESTSDEIEVLASREKIMLINKRPSSVSVNLNGRNHSLEGYEVRVMDTP